MHEALQLNGELPPMREPLVIGAFWGWSDNSGTAMGTVRYLRETWAATEVATADADRFYDLTVARPRIRREGGEPIIRWPGTRFHFAHPPGGNRDVVLLAGREPSLRWREYAEVVGEFMAMTGAKQFLALGSRPAPVPHTRPAPVQLGDADRYFEQLFDLTSERSRYEGPTGIQTVLLQHLRERGISTGRLTALVPGYLNVGPSPRAMVALAEALDRAVGSTTLLEPLFGEIDAFERRVQQATSQLDNPQQLHDQVSELEAQYDAQPPAAYSGGTVERELPSSGELLQEIEDLLRRGRPDDDRTAR
jgi:hypothetical protein